MESERERKRERERQSIEDIPSNVFVAVARFPSIEIAAASLGLDRDHP